MKCHYEVLGIPRDADDAQIKSAYKKLALKWHPDKNLENPEEAKEQFQLVQQAYEILGDRQERAWYDKYREQILRGANSEFKDNSLNVFQYFTTTCFKGYNDDHDGFYTVYRKVFEQIAKEDLEFMEDRDEFCQIPSFGYSTSDYDEVVGPFYAYWSSYSTKKTYVWLDPYNINEIRERRLIKLVEKENKKIRQKARKERNEEVRNLVAFVRKRDKRVQEHVKQVEAKILENRQKHEQISKQKRLERKKQHENHSQAEWTKFDNVQSELEEIERHLAEEFGEQLSDEDEEEEDENLYCVACNKTFKTLKALQNHESSKKHKENLQILKQTMLEDENDISESSDDQENDSDDKEKREACEDKINGELIDVGAHIQTDTKSTDGASESSLPRFQSKKKKKNKKTCNPKNKENQTMSLEDDVLIATLPNNEELGKFSDDDYEYNKGKKQKRRGKRLNLKANKTEGCTLAGDNSEDLILEKSDCQKESNSKKETVTATNIENNCCVTCKSVFPSKNKLFNHLKVTGHSVYIPKEQNQKPCKQKKNSKGKST